jgi:ribosomal protein S18 acetylase RimI-like enzyme
MSANQTFERASPERVEEVLPLFRAYQAQYAQLTDASEEQTRQFFVELLSDSERGFMVLAVTDGRIVGFATGFVTVSGVIASRIVHLGDLYVEPAYRGQSIGARLVDEVSAEAHRRGIPLVRWLSIASNEKLNRWYERLGARGSDFKLFLKDV